MADETFTLKISTPSGLFAEDTVSEVTVPTERGEIGVLPGHAEYSGVLGTGIVQYFSHSSDTVERVVISGGFASFSSGDFLILADSADSSSTVDKATYASERPALLSELEDYLVGSVQWERTKTALDRIEAIDELISN